MDQYAWPDQHDTKDSGDNQQLQRIVEHHILMLPVCTPQFYQEKNKNQKTQVEVDIHIADIVDFNQQVYGKNRQDHEQADRFFRSPFAIYHRNRPVV